MYSQYPGQLFLYSERTLQFFQSARSGTPASCAAASRPKGMGWRCAALMVCTRRLPSGRTTKKYSPVPTASLRAARPASPYAQQDTENVNRSGHPCARLLQRASGL